MADEIITNARRAIWRDYANSYEHCGKPVAKGWTCRRKKAHEGTCGVGLESGYRTWLSNRGTENHA